MFFEVAVLAGLLDEGGVGLCVVPFVGVADPFPLLFGEEAGFDALAGLCVARFQFEGEGFDHDGAVGEVPAAAVGDFDFAFAGDGQIAFLEGAIGPEGGDDVVGDNACGHAVFRDGGEEAGVAEFVRKFGDLRRVCGWSGSELEEFAGVGDEVEFT